MYLWVDDIRTPPCNDWLWARSVSEACRMGAIFLDPSGKIQKCDGCIERQRAGKIPACVRVCPTGALYLEEDS